MNSLDQLCFNKLHKHIQEYIFWKDEQNKYLGCNEKFAKEAGLKKASDIIGLSDAELPWKGELADIYREEDKYVLTTGKSIENREVPFKDIDKNDRIILINKYPLIDNDNQIKGVLGVFVDVTDTKNSEKLEIEKLQLEKQLAEEKAHNAKLAAGSIAHDLRTPLASINAGMVGIAHFLEPLLKTYDIAKESGLDIPLINKNKLAALSQVISNCNNEIAFSHNFINQTLNNLQHDSIDTSGYKKYNIKTVLESALESYPYQRNEKALLHFEIAVDFEFWGSDVYVKNMLNNLLKNSFHYIAAARRGEIYITTLENEDNFILQFKDTAQGAPVEVVEHMFDGYFSKRKGGTGLGLAFCKTVMESFNGFIKAHSVEGEFIEFTLLFPKLA